VDNPRPFGSGWEVPNLSFVFCPPSLRKELLIFLNFLPILFDWDGEDKKQIDFKMVTIAVPKIDYEK